MKRTLYELLILMMAILARALQKQDFLELPIERRLLVCSNAIERIF
jgi:hypothetical protein